jgi:hypothetical protein
MRKVLDESSPNIIDRTIWISVMRVFHGENDGKGTTFFVLPCTRDCITQIAAEQYPMKSSRMVSI